MTRDEALRSTFITMPDGSLVGMIFDDKGVSRHVKITDPGEWKSLIEAAPLLYRVNVSALMALESYLEAVEMSDTTEAMQLADQLTQLIAAIKFIQQKAVDT